MQDFGINFRSDRDDYVSIWFDSPLRLNMENVRPEVSGFGARPLSVTELREHFWQVNFKLPPLPRAGWHDVRVRLEGGKFSNPQRIALDMPLVVGRVRLGKACDGATWKEGELDTSKGLAISFWVQGLPENADLHNVTATLGGRKMRMLYLEPPSKEAPRGLLGRRRSAPRQANAALTGSLPAGRVPLAVRVGGKLAGECIMDVRS
jgi:hypothetical protein